MQLNQEQKRIINAKPNGHTLLKGVAGSGKTTIAVTRLPFLLHNYCFDVDDRILLVAYNKTLVNYFKYLYSKVRVQLEFLKLLYNGKDYSSLLFITDTAQSMVCFNDTGKKFLSEKILEYEAGKV